MTLQPCHCQQDSTDPYSILQPCQQDSTDPYSILGNTTCIQYSMRGVGFLSSSQRAGGWAAVWQLVAYVLGLDVARCASVHHLLIDFACFAVVDQCTYDLELLTVRDPHASKWPGLER